MSFKIYTADVLALKSDGKLQVSSIVANLFSIFFYHRDVMFNVM